MFQFPISLLLGVLFILLTYLLHSWSKAGTLVRFLAGWRCGAIVMSLFAVLMAVEGIWGIDIHDTIPFWIAVLILQLCLELTVLQRIRNDKSWNRRKLAFMATHSGIFIMAWAAFWGAPDCVEANIRVDSFRPTNMACTENGRTVPLPFSLQLEEFVIDRYEDGVSPKQYTSRLQVSDLVGNRSGALSDQQQHPSTVSIATSVNHPGRFKGYRIYQEGFDQYEQAYTILRVVRDPWLPVVYIGMILLAIGSGMMLAGSWKGKVLLPSVAVLAVIFAVASVAKINFGTLPPALRSLWFVPHLIVYMVAYSAMAISVLLALAALFKTKYSDNFGDISQRLLRSSSVLLLAGMLCGCVWAKQAWGDYWAWDPKECWAGVTWLLTLVYMHMLHSRKSLMVTALLLSFLSLQITWYGVNYLPSAKESMHTYNTK